MRYLNPNPQSQFERVSDSDARMLMETFGYDLPPTPEVIKSMYVCDDRSFALSDEVVEASDDFLYLRLEELGPQSVVEVDESGRQPIIDTIVFEEEDFGLEGIYQDDEGGLFACLVSENAEDEYESDGAGEEDTDEE